MDQGLKIRFLRSDSIVNRETMSILSILNKCNMVLIIRGKIKTIMLIIIIFCTELEFL